MTAQPETAVRLLDARSGMTSAWHEPPPCYDGHESAAALLRTAGHIGSTVAKGRLAYLDAYAAAAPEQPDTSVLAHIGEPYSQCRTLTERDVAAILAGWHAEARALTYPPGKWWGTEPPPDVSEPAPVFLPGEFLPAVSPDYAGIAAEVREVAAERGIERKPKTRTGSPLSGLPRGGEQPAPELDDDTEAALDAFNGLHDGAPPYPDADDERPPGRHQKDKRRMRLRRRSR